MAHRVAPRPRMTNRFFLRASFPYLGRDDVLVLRVAHGRRDMDVLLPR